MDSHSGKVGQKKWNCKIHSLHQIPTKSVYLWKNSQKLPQIEDLVTKDSLPKNSTAPAPFASSPITPKRFQSIEQSHERRIHEDFEVVQALGSLRHLENSEDHSFLSRKHSYDEVHLRQRMLAAASTFFDQPSVQVSQTAPVSNVIYNPPKSISLAGLGHTEHQSEDVLKKTMFQNPRPKKKRRKSIEVERNFKCPVPGCTKSYGSEGALKTHRKLKHNEDYPARSTKTLQALQAARNYSSNFTSSSQASPIAMHSITQR